jgi:hypothetical protein
MMISLTVNGSIYNAAIHQPKVADEIYRYPHSIKGEIHFLSAWEDVVFSISHPVMIVSFAIGCVVFGLLKYLERRNRSAAMDGILDRFDKEA